MIYEKKQLPELFQMKHRHDTNDKVGYENSIVERNLSPYLFNNNFTRGFLLNLKPMLSLFLDKMNIVNNFKNYLVDKDHYN